MVAAVADAEIVVVMRERTPFPARLLARLPRLRLLVTSGMRNAALDVAAANGRGVVVCGTPSSPTPPVELTWALVLGLARQLVPESVALRAGGPWQSSVGRDLAGATLGVVGLGKIGAASRPWGRRSAWTWWRGASTSPTSARPRRGYAARSGCPTCSPRATW